MLAQTADDVADALGPSGPRRSSGSSTAPGSRCTKRRRSAGLHAAPQRRDRRLSRGRRVPSARLPAGEPRPRRRGDRAPEERPPASVPGRRCAASDGGSTFGAMRRALPLASFYFDCLFLDGEPLLDRPQRSASRCSNAVLPAETARADESSPAIAREAERFTKGALDGGPRGRHGESARRTVRRRLAGQGLAQGEDGAHARPRRARGRVGKRPAARAGSATCTSGRATRRRETSSCWGRPSKA